MRTQTKRKVFCVILGIFSISITHAQVEKGYWLTGGTLSYSSGESPVYKTSYLVASPKAAYFFIDKLAVGLNIRAEYQRTKALEPALSSPPSIFTYISAGPIVRYYFLEPDKLINVFTDGSLLFGQQWQRKGANRSDNFQYITNAGANIFFTKSAALEFSVGYQSSIYGSRKNYFRSVIIGIGFQAHLTKNR